MEKTVEYFAEQLAGIHYGVPTPGLIDTIKVDYHGQMTPIKYLATTVPQQGRIAVTPYDPVILGVLDKTLKVAGFNSYVFSKTTVVIVLPKWANSSDREKVLAQIRKLAEEAKVAIRNRRKKIRQTVEGSEDETRGFEKKLQEMTDGYITRIDMMAAKKTETFS